MKKAKDGWHIIQGYDVFVKDGKVLRGTRDGVTVYPYRKDFVTQYDRYLRPIREWGGGWNECIGISLSAFSAGVRRGSIEMY